MKEFFLLIWRERERPHYSEVSNTYPGSEPLSIFFHHILPKSRYPEAKYDKKNIILLTFEEHNSCELYPTKYEAVNKKREALKKAYMIEREHKLTK